LVFAVELADSRTGVDVYVAAARRRVDLGSTVQPLRCEAPVSISSELNHPSGPANRMRAALILTVAAGCTASTGLAQTTAPAPTAAEAKLAQNAAPAGRRAQPPGKTPARKKPANDALASCLAQWDKGTHMSRQEWNRACRRVANRLQNINVSRPAIRPRKLLQRWQIFRARCETSD